MNCMHNDLMHIILYTYFGEIPINVYIYIYIFYNFEKISNNGMYS